MLLVQRRIGLLFALFLLLLGVVCIRSVWLTGVRGSDLRNRAMTQQVREIDVPARRGTITDRHGVQLAVSEDAVTVFANPFLIKDPARVARRVAPLVGRSEGRLRRLLADRRRGFAYLRRKLDPASGARIERLKIRGIGTVAEPRRVYPHGRLAAQVLGWVGTDNYGLFGVEQSREETLHGRDGKHRLVKDALGQPVSIVEDERSEAGRDLRLTIDAALQQHTEKVLAEVGTTYRPRGSTAVVMDPRTGAVLALGNWPSLDANRFGRAPQSARQNRAVVASYEPGSTFKPFTVAGALSEGVVKPSSWLRLPPKIRVADRTITEDHAAPFGTLTTGEILARSSNVGTVMIGLKLGSRRFDRWVRRFGFGKPTGIELPGEGPGIVPRPRDYSGSSMGNLPIGQGLAVPTVQMAAGFTAIANRGVLHEPYLIDGGRRPGRRVISPRVAAQVSRMLEGVVGAEGTAREVHVPGYRLAGKTGTAEKPNGRGGYSKTRYVASFIGYAPARNPGLLVAVVVDEPKGQIYGGTVAAPAFQRIAEFALPYLGIPPG